MKNPFKTKKYKDQTIQELKTDNKINIFLCLSFLSLPFFIVVKEHFFPMHSIDFIIGFSGLAIAVCAIIMMDIVSASVEIRLREYVSEKLGEKT
jgi:hypothetical protein